MRVYATAPEPNDVRDHFVKMAKNEVNPTARRLVGLGFAGTRLKLGGRSILRGGSSSSLGDSGRAPVVIQPMVPSEVGVQQARSQLVTQQMHKEAVRGLVRKRRSGSNATKKKKKKKKIQRKRKRFIKKTGKKGKSHSIAGKRRKSKKKKKKRTKNGSDNFS
jgi:hypothetical protein